MDLRESAKSTNSPPGTQQVLWIKIKIGLIYFCFVFLTEIVFLRTTMPVYGSYKFGTYDVKFDILHGNVENAFEILKRVEDGLYVGKWMDFDFNF